MDEADVEVGKSDFEFYAKFAKSLILTLNCTEDRILASAWFSKLRDETSGSEKLRTDYLKLLLFVLQRHRLAGPFIENPNIEETLPEFEEDYDLAKIARQIIEKEQKERRETCLKKIRGEIGDFPPYSTDYSADLREYVAAQDIPNFGVHVYYAISKDPILEWENAHHAVFPKAVRKMEPQGDLAETSFAVTEPVPEGPDDTQKYKIMEETGVTPDLSIFAGRKTRERKSPFVDIERPAQPLGILPGEGEEEIIDEEVPPPTWGSNLIEVREPIEAEGPDIPPEEAKGPPPGEVDPEDPEILELLDQSFKMEDIMAEVETVEVDDVPTEFEVDPAILAEEAAMKDIEEAMDRHDAAIAAAIASLDEDEQRMLMEMEAEEKAGIEPKPKPKPKKEVKVVADDDTVIKVLVEEPGATKVTTEEKKRKEKQAAEDKKKKPVGRTGLNKGKAKGAILKPGEKKKLEEDEKKAKVVASKTGIAKPGQQKRPGVPKPKASTTKVKEATSTGKIPSAKSSTTEAAAKKGGKPGAKGIPKPGAKGKPKPGAKKGESAGLTAAREERDAMQNMVDRLEKMLADTKAEFPEEYPEEADGPSTSTGGPTPQQPPRKKKQLTPIQEMSMAASMSPGSPEADDILLETEKEYEILEKLFGLYESLAPGQPEELRTPPVFSKHPQIRELGRQLRYRADEFDIHPQEKFQRATKYFAEQGKEPPPYFYDPRLKGRTGTVKVPEELRVPGAPSQDDLREPLFEPATPPWSNIEVLKDMVRTAERRVEEAPALAGGVGVTTPKLAASPKRIARDLGVEFDMGSPPEFAESPPPTPPEMTTPEFARIQSYGFPEIITAEQLKKRYAEKLPEYEAFLEAEAADERERWKHVYETREPIRALPGPIASPGAESFVTPVRKRRGGPRPISPPSVGRQPGGTPEGPPPLAGWASPEGLKMEIIEHIPKYVPPVVELPDPENFFFTYPPFLVDADLDEYDFIEEAGLTREGFADPFQELAEKEPFEMGLDIDEEMMGVELVGDEDISLERPESPLSPHLTLQRELREHVIPKEFFDDERRKMASRNLKVGRRVISYPRSYIPRGLSRKMIEEDIEGEEFEEMEYQAEKDVEKFLDYAVSEEGKAEKFKAIIKEAEQEGFLALDEEDSPPDMVEFDEEYLDIPMTPPSPVLRTPERPQPPTPGTPKVPPPGRVLWEAVPRTPEKRFIQEEEEMMLASPGLPSPPPPPPPPPTPPPSAPSREALLYDSPPPLDAEYFLQEDIDESLLASPEMLMPMTPEELYADIPKPIDWPPFGQPWPPKPPASPPKTPPPPQVQSPLPRRAGAVSPVTPPLDSAALQRELKQHEIKFRKAKAGGYRAGKKWIPRRSARNYQYVPIIEDLDYESSKRVWRPRTVMAPILHKLAPMPPPGPLPQELMGEEYHGQFYHPLTLMDRPVSPDLPSPIRPKQQPHGWETPPHLRGIRMPPPIDLMPDTGPWEDAAAYSRASHYRDPLLFEEPPEGIYLPDEDDIIPLELMEEGFKTPPRRVRMPSPTAPVVTYPSAALEPPEGTPLANLTMAEQINQAAQMAQWQTEQIISPSREPTPSPPRQPSPLRPSPVRQPSPRRQPSPPRVPSPPRPPSPQRLAAPSFPIQRTPPPPFVRAPPVRKRVRDISFTTEVYDPESPEGSTRWTRGRTELEFNQGEEGQLPVVTPPSQGVAVYARGPPVSADEFSPVRIPERPITRVERALKARRRPRRPMMRAVPEMVEGEGTPRRAGLLMPRRRVLDEVAPRRKLFSEQGYAEHTPLPARPPVKPSRWQRLYGSPPPPPRIEITEASPPEATPAFIAAPTPAQPQGESIQIVEEYEETENDFIPEHLRGFRWMDSDDYAEDQFSTFRQQFK